MIFIACVLVAQAAIAQVPWEIKLTPTLNPLPVGLCGAVHLSIRETSGADAPRNPQGQRVTLADFDITVESTDGNSVVAQQIDASHWSVCACQGAAPGTAATITASYPARSLSESARVPRTSVQATARIETAAPKGTVNPPGCGTLAAQRAPIAGASQPISPPVTVTPPIAALPNDATPRRTARYEPAPVTVTFALKANGSWYEPGSTTVTFAMRAQGSWYEPGPVTATFDLTATGNWIERERR